MNYLKEQNQYFQNKMYVFEENIKSYLRDNYNILDDDCILYSIGSNLHTILHILRQFNEYNIWNIMEFPEINYDNCDMFFILKTLCEIIQSATENIKKSVLVYSAIEKTMPANSFGDMFADVDKILNEIFSFTAGIYEMFYNIYDTAMESIALTQKKNPPRPKQFFRIPKKQEKQSPSSMEILLPLMKNMT